MKNAVIGALRGTLGLDSTSFRDGIGRAQKSLGGFQKSVKKAGKNFQNVGKKMSVGVSAPLIAGFAGILKASGDFEQSMNRVSALSGATGKSFDRLRNQAKDLGATTQFSASQAADAMGFLAMAGFNAEQILGSMPATLQLAAAAQLDLASSADIVSNVMTGFGVETAGLGNVVDVLTKAFTSSNTDLVQLGDAMKFVGPVAKAAGLSFNETAAAIGLLGQAGIQGEMGGTALRGMLTKLLDPSKEAAARMKELKVNVIGADGKIKSLSGILKEFAPHAEDAGSMMKIFGQRAGPAMLALLSQGEPALAEMIALLDNAGGTAERVAKTQMKGFNGEMKAMKSALEGLAIAIGDSGLLEFMADMVKRVTGFLRSMTETNPEIFKMGTIVAGLAIAIGPLLAGLGLMMTALAPIAGVIALVVSPLGLLAAAVATAGVAIYSNWGTLKEDFPAITSAITGAVDGLIVVFNRFKDIAGIVGDHVLDSFRLFATGIEALLNGDFKGALDAGLGIVESFGDMVFGIMDTMAGGMLTKGLEIGAQMIAGIRQGIAEKWESLKAWFSEKADQMPSWVRKALGIRSPSRVFAEIGGFIVDGLTQGIKGGFGSVSEVMSGLTDQLVVADTKSGIGGITSEVEKLGARSETVFGKLAKTVGGMIAQGNSLGETFQGVFQSISQNLLTSGLNGLGGALGGLFSGGGGGGGGIFGSIMSGLFGFKDGGSFNVGGAGGIDSQLVAFKASPDENVHITKPNQAIGGGGGVTRVQVVPSPMFDVVVKQIAHSEAASVSSTLFNEGQRTRNEGARRR